MRLLYEQYSHILSNQRNIIHWFTVLTCDYVPLALELSSSYIKANTNSLLLSTLL